jgi:uncharacterized membrane protein YeaQ/YmgE (transglycosylase-associated protein family)
MPEAIEFNSLIVLLAVGLVAGWLAGLIMQGSGYGIIGNIIIGIVGAFIGFYLLRGLHVAMPYGIVGTIITATIGAVVLMFFIGLLRR